MTEDADQDPEFEQFHKDIDRHLRKPRIVVAADAPLTPEHEARLKAAPVTHVDLASRTVWFPDGRIEGMPPEEPPAPE